MPRFWNSVPLLFHNDTTGMFTVVKDGEVVGKLTNDVERSSELFGMKEQNLVTMILFPITPQKNQFSGVFCADPSRHPERPSDP